MTREEAKSKLAELLTNGLKPEDLYECAAEYVNRTKPDPIRAYLTALLADAADLDYRWLNMRNTAFETARSFRLAWLVSRGGSAKLVEEKLLSFCSEQKSFWCVPSGGGFVVLLDAAETGRISALAEAFEGLKICLSDEYENLRDTTAQLELARMALNFSATDLRGDNLIEVDDYKPLIAYFYARSNSNLDIFTNNLLERIKKYDAKCGTAYLETLRVCIHCNQDPGLIAHTLNIHKNTVFYRLRQLKELFNVDLKNMRQIANLYFSLCLEYHR